MNINPICTAPSESEIASRVARVQAKMREEGLDYYVCHDPDNVFYLTNFANFVHERPFHDMLAARDLAYELTKPGNSMSEVDRQVNNLLKSRGYAENLLHRTGHGFGVTSHEAPFLAEGYDREIKPGMVFSIEPGIYLPGVGGFRFSDTILITETGNQKLTEAPESLAELTLNRSSSFRDTIRSWAIQAFSKRNKTVD